MTDRPERPGEPSESTTEPPQASTEPRTEPTEVTNEPPAEPAPASTIGTQPPSATPPKRFQWLSSPNRLNRVAALVAIVAGSVFVAAVIFGTGVLRGRTRAGTGKPLSAPATNAPNRRWSSPSVVACRRARYGWSRVAVAQVGTATTATRVAMPVPSSGPRFSH
jgi:hypothetical protein